MEKSFVLIRKGAKTFSSDQLKLEDSGFITRATHPSNRQGLPIVLSRSMAGLIPSSSQANSLLARHPIKSYFALTYFVSWCGALGLAAPHLLRGESIPKLTGLIMFPLMLLGPVAMGIFMARLVDGRPGLSELFSRMRRFRVPARWYAVLLIPPVLISLVLFAMKTLVSPDFAPNRFYIGFSFGILAGLLEEVGWMGFAFPKMRRPENALVPATLLGLLWSAWHIPVVDFLGTSTPHGAYWLHFFLAFTAAMTAMRVLIAWVYVNTESIVLCQLLHAVSTGSLVVFSPPRVSAAQESLWYAVYGVALWFVVAVIASMFGKRLASQEPQSS